MVGNLASIAQGLGEMGFGEGVAGTGGAMIAGTSGLGTVPGVLTIGVGYTITAHGFWVGVRGIAGTVQSAIDIMEQRGNGGGGSPTGGDRPKGEQESGSYTIEFENGMKYHGKGDKARMEQSAREKAKEYGSPVKDKNWTSSKNSRDGFKGESRRLKADGGHKNPKNYNQRDSPGTKYLEQDGEK